MTDFSKKSNFALPARSRIGAMPAFAVVGLLAKGLTFDSATLPFDCIVAGTSSFWALEYANTGLGRSAVKNIGCAINTETVGN